MNDPGGSIASATTTYAYNALGEETSETDPDPASGTDDSSSPITTFTYDNAGDALTTTVTAAAVAGVSPAISRTTTDTYDAAGDVTQETGASPGVAGEAASNVMYSYNSDGEMTSEDDYDETTDVGGTALATWALGTDQYNNLGELLATIAPPLSSGANAGPDVGLSPETINTYDNDGNVMSSATLTAANTWATTTYAYDHDGNELSETDPTNDAGITPTTYFTYDFDGDQTSVKNADGKTTGYQYDDLGREMVETDPNGATTTNTYDAAGDVLTSVLAGVGLTAPETTRYGYDDVGDATSTILPDGASSSSTFDALGNMLTSTALNGTTTTNLIDALGDVTQSTTGSEVSKSIFDSLGEQLKSIDARGAETSETLDGAGNDIADDESDPSATDDPDRSEDTEVVSPSGQVLASTTPAGTTYYTYDLDGNELSEIDPNGQTIDYEYDAAGRQIAEIDSDGGATTETDNAYDADGNLASQTIASEGVSHTTSYLYDGDGNVTQSTDPEGQIITDAYNNEGELATETWYTSASAQSAGDPSNVINYTYDAAGDILTASDDNSSYTFTYNADGEETSVDNHGADGAPDIVLTSAYTNDLRTSFMASGADSFVNTYGYDEYENLTSETQTGPGVASKSIIFGYDGDNDLDSLTRSADGALVATSNYNINLDGLTNYIDNTNAAGDTIDDFSYSYDGDDRVSTFGTTADGTATYGYDADGQVESATYTGAQAAESFSYDDAGNRTSVDGTSTDVSAFNQVTNDGTYSYQYNADGDLIEQTTINGGAYEVFTYNVGNELASATLYTSAGVETEQVVYTYDMFNNLIDRADTLYSDGVAGTTTKQESVYDDPANNGQMQLQFQTTGSATPVAANLTDRYLWGPAVDQLLADEQVTNPDSAGNTLWTLDDDENTVRDVVNSSGVVQDHIAYSVFGQAVSHTATNPAAVDTIFGFQGLIQDPTTKMDSAVDRIYDPLSGTFTTPDPAQADNNTYRAFGNNPTGETDPSGLEDSAQQAANASKYPGLNGFGPVSRPLANYAAEHPLTSPVTGTLAGYFAFFDGTMFNAIRGAHVEARQKASAGIAKDQMDGDYSRVAAGYFVYGAVTFSEGIAQLSLLTVQTVFAMPLGGVPMVASILKIPGVSKGVGVVGVGLAEWNAVERAADGTLTPSDLILPAAGAKMFLEMDGGLSAVLPHESLISPPKEPLLRAVSEGLEATAQRMANTQSLAGEASAAETVVPRIVEVGVEEIAVAPKTGGLAEIEAQNATTAGFHELGAIGVKPAPVVTAKGMVSGKTFVDVNQSARFGADPSKPTLISDRISAKAAKSGKVLPNGNMATAHAEIGVIQKAFDAGVTAGADMVLAVEGQEVCGYCRGDIAAAAGKAGLRSITVIEVVTGKILAWKPGMTTLSEVQ